MRSVCTMLVVIIVCLIESPQTSATNEPLKSVTEDDIRSNSLNGQSNAEPSRVEMIASEQIPIRCGANALYMLIKIRGGEIDFSALTKLLEQRTAGNSMLELRDAANHFGYRVVIEKRVGFDLEPSVLPVIAYLPSQRPELSGHFVVLVAQNAEQITYLDGTTASYVNVRRKWFCEAAPGYIIRYVEAEHAHVLETITFVIIIVLAAVVCRYVWL